MHRNALAAIAALEAAGLAPEEIGSRAQELPRPGAPDGTGRSRRGNVLFVNDSKATNAEGRRACSVDLRAHLLDCRRACQKEGGIESLRPLFGRIAKAYLIGEAAPAFASVLGATIPYEISGTIRSAVENAAADSAGDASLESVVLLSPACASFDQFRNFEVRGDAFREAVGGSGPRGNDWKERLMVSRVDRSPMANWWWTVDRWFSLAAFLSLMGLGVVLSFGGEPRRCRTDRPRQLPFRDPPADLHGAGGARPHRRVLP